MLGVQVKQSPEPSQEPGLYFLFDMDVTFGTSQSMRFLPACLQGCRAPHVFFLKKLFTFSKKRSIVFSTKGKGEATMKLYHGSLIENLTISNSEAGLGYNFGAVFFARTYRTANEYGDYVYQCEVDVNAIFTNGDLPYFEDGVAGTALHEVMAERGIDEIHFDLCWQAVVSEELDFQEQEKWVDLLGMDEDDAGWEAQAMRIAFARKLGFRAVEMNDECGSIAVLPEFITLEAATDEDDEEEDE